MSQSEWGSSNADFYAARDRRVRGGGLSVTATNARSPQDKKYTLAVLEGLDKIPVLGPAVAGALETASPSVLDLARVHADASATGISHACATTFEASCDGMPSPVTLKINFGALNTAKVTESGATVIGPIDLVGGDNVWQRLADEGASTDLVPVLQMLANAIPLNLSLEHGKDVSKSGSKIAVTSGLLGLSASQIPLLEVGDVRVTCGPNTGSGKPGSETGGEAPLGGIQSDEGRSSVPAVSWRALNGMP